MRAEVWGRSREEGHPATSQIKLDGMVGINSLMNTVSEGNTVQVENAHLIQLYYPFQLLNIKQLAVLF